MGRQGSSTRTFPSLLRYRRRLPARDGSHGKDATELKRNGLCIYLLRSPVEPTRGIEIPQLAAGSLPRATRRNWIMRPTLFISAVLTLTCLAVSAGADDKPQPPSFSVASGSLTVKASGASHLNPDYSWSIKDGSNKSLKSKTDFAFSGGTAKEPMQASVPLVAGTLKGAYCTASNCIPFSATCSASGCTIN
jgi:hypothetical protein